VAFRTSDFFTNIRGHGSENKPETRNEVQDPEITDPLYSNPPAFFSSKE